MKSRFFNSLIFPTAIVCSLGSAAEAANMNYLGVWSNAAIYKLGSVVVYNSAIYYSLKSTKAAPNRNYTPSNNPSWWQQVGTVGNTILNGVGNPFDQSLGQVGDFYLNTTTNTLFGPKTAIAGWPAVGVALTGSGGGAGPQGPAGPFVVDVNGKDVGMLIGNDVQITTPDGAYKLPYFERSRYDSTHMRYYLSPDCSGEPYMEANALIPAARIVDAGGHTQSLDGNYIFTGQMEYPTQITRLTTHSQSYKRINFGVSPPVYDELCYPVDYTAYVGRISSVPVDWTPPFAFKQ